MMNVSALIHSLRRSLLHIELRLLQAAGLDVPPPPCLAMTGPSLLPPLEREPLSPELPELTDSILWMAAPKSRRTIEVNRTRRRSEHYLIKVKKNIEPCPECGHLKQKHVLCGFCYAKVSKETSLIRMQIKEMEDGPFRAPAVDTLILYEGETPQKQDKDKRIVERPRKRPAWFTY